jgi:hypothetical protein
MGGKNRNGKERIDNGGIGAKEMHGNVSGLFQYNITGKTFDLGQTDALTGLSNNAVPDKKKKGNDSDK